MSFVFDLPLWIVGLVLVVVMTSLVAVGLLFARRRVLPRFQFTDLDGDFISTLVHSVVVFYALTVAMIAITVWETYDAAAQIVSEEATALATLYRDVGAYPESTREQLQDALRDYTEHVIEEAWPEQHKGLIPRRRSRINQPIPGDADGLRTGNRGTEDPARRDPAGLQPYD